MHKPLRTIQFEMAVKKAVHTARMMEEERLTGIVIDAINLYKEYKSSRYYSVPKFKKPPKPKANSNSDHKYEPPYDLEKTTHRLIKRPSNIHIVKPGRYNQENARVVLISTLATVWIRGKSTKPTVNKKNAPDSPFVKFVSDIFWLVGIGNLHRQLERYVSIRKKSNNII